MEKNKNVTDEKRKELEDVLRKKYGNTAAVIVQKNGVTQYEHYMNEASQNSPIHVFSITKSIVSLLIGIAFDQGLIQNIDCPILDFFPDYYVEPKRSEIKKITLRDMMTMTVPYRYFFGPYGKYFSSDDWVKFSLDMLGGRGKLGKFRYAPLIGPDILSAILIKVTGMSVLEYANKVLFGPLDIQVSHNVCFNNKEEQMAFYKSREVSGWVASPKGVNTAGWGLMLTPGDMAKIGELMRNHGRWNGKQIISDKWICECTSPKSCFRKNLLYGYLWWILDEKEHAFAAMGDGGNVIYVNEKKGLVVVIAAYFVKRSADRIELIKQYIEPVFGE